jgi:NtrC-family two-component system sensor histidine kinase KinB
MSRAQSNVEQQSNDSQNLGDLSLALRNALTHAQTEAMLRERVIELATIEDVSRPIAAALDRDIIASDVLAVAMSAIDTEVGTCLLANPSGEFEVVARYDTPETHQPLTGQINPPSQVIAQVLRTEQAALVANTQQNGHEIGAGLTPGARSVLCVPLLSEDRAIGVLLFEDTAASAFSETHLRIVKTLAAHAVVAIANAQLYQAVCAGRDQLQAILDSTRDAVLLFDHYGRLLRFNPVAEEMLEQPLDAYLGQSFLSWLRSVRTKCLQEFAGFSLRQFRHYVRDVVRYPTRVTQRRFQQVRGEEIRYIDETGSPVFDHAGQPVGWLIVWRDRTEEHKRETMRRELSSMVVHDLRNPITSIISSMGVLQNLLDDGEADRTVMNEVIQIARTSAENVLNLVQSLLDVSRLEQSNITLDCASLSLVDAIDNAVMSVLALALPANITIETRTPTDLPAVWIDDEKLQRVLVNLLDNALRYTPCGGTIAIEAHHQTDEKVALVRVEDTGPGIAPEARSRIFDKFVQLDQSVLRGHKGTGLGLTFCKLVIEAHGGHIWVEESPMGGAAFCFTVPVVPA